MVIKKVVDDSNRDDFVKWFSELSNKDVEIAGGKGASLAEMYNAKFPVPPGFMITAQAFDYFLKKMGISQRIAEIIKTIEFENTETLQKKSREIRDLIESQKLPKELESEILESYHILGTEKIDTRGVSKDALNILKHSYEPIFVSVRSSATTEDLADASFAGQQESFLNVKGDVRLIENVKKCFSSLYTPRAIYYRHQKGFDNANALLSVVIMKMIDSQKSGVMFTRNPIGNQEDILIEAVFGLGEGIVSGQIKPDDYFVSRDLKIKDIKLNDKKIAFVRTSSGDNGIVKLSPEKSKSQVMTNGQIVELANYGLRLEEHYGKPQDIEFAIDTDRTYIVQSRPITTLGGEKKKGKELSGKVLLEGLGSSPGIGVGVVKLIKSMDDLNKIKKGDVLVTEMTNPDMVVAMQRSVAIVTDEGGVTCFGEDTNVLTNKGFITIKEVKDIVNSREQVILFAYDSVNMKPVWKKIISAASRKRKAIRVSVSQKGITNDNFIDLTSDHKMFTFDNRQLIKEKISSIINNQKYLCLVDSLPDSPKINQEKLAYLMGALLTDGNVSIYNYHTGNPRRGRITFTQKEIPEKEKFITRVRKYFWECFGDRLKDGRLKETPGNIGGRLIQGYASDFICNNLELAIGFTKLSQNIDSWVLGLDYNSCLSYLAGLIDGDGSFYRNRIHIYVGKENVLKSIILACLNLGIFPQVTKNRNIHHVQILEKMDEILRFTARLRGKVDNKLLGNKLFAARQIIGDIIDEVNYKGRIKPYVKNNLLIDSRKILFYLMPLADDKLKSELFRIVNSSLRMQRVKNILDIGEIEVYNLEIEADNELDHNFIVFTKKYTPLLVSNSHASIVSRELGIPCVVGTEKATSVLKDGMIITVDGTNGKVYEGKVGETTIVEIKKALPTNRVKLKVIVDMPESADRAAKSGIEHVGLTRLEGIIASSQKHPLYYEKNNTLDEYTELLKKALEKIASHFKSMLIRSSDIRTDEFSDLEGAPVKEMNPMLGLHGIRFSLKHPKIFEAELLAIKKVAEKHPDKKFGIMFPQVILIDEVRKAKEYFDKYKTKNMVFGVMIETPAAVQIIEDICKEKVDFISFGTNDLTQFTLAVDREEEDVQYLYNELNPAIFSQIKRVIGICRRYKVETSICGQAGSKPEMAEFLFRKGINSISVNADAAYDVSVLINKLEEEWDNNKPVYEANKQNQHKNKNMQYHNHIYNNKQNSQHQKNQNQYKEEDEEELIFPQIIDKDRADIKDFENGENEEGDVDARLSIAGEIDNMEDIKREEWKNSKNVEKETKRELESKYRIENNIVTEVEDVRGKEEKEEPEEELDTDIDGIDGLKLDKSSEEGEESGESEETKGKEEKDDYSVYDFEDEYK